MTTWASHCCVARIIYGLRTSDDICPTYSLPGADAGLAHHDEFALATKQHGDNRILPAEDVLNEPLRSNYQDHDVAISEFSVTGQPNEQADLERVAMHEATVNYRFVMRLGLPELTIATIILEENFTKKHTAEAKGLLKLHFEEALRHKADVILGKFGVMGYTSGDVSRLTRGRSATDRRCSHASTLLESLIWEINWVATDEVDKVDPPLIFGNADPHAALAEMAASSGRCVFPPDIERQYAHDSITVYYLDWKKTAEARRRTRRENRPVCL